jgi:hypothetical protein
MSTHTMKGSAAYSDTPTAPREYFGYTGEARFGILSTLSGSAMSGPDTQGPSLTFAV